MPSATKGIVISTSQYGETSIITRIFTEEFGLHSFIVNGVRKKNSRMKSALFSPLSQLDLIIYFHEKKKIHRIREVRPFLIYQNIHNNPSQNGILLFLSEVISRSLHEGHTDKALFNYIADSLEKFDQTEFGIVNFHLGFLCGFAQFLGFWPEQNYSETNCYFSIQNGTFTHSSAINELCFTKETSKQFAKLLDDWENTFSFTISSSERRVLLEAILRYYEYHIPSFGNVRSLEILQEIFAA
ncbi:MAG: DNA repair protein RecO [Bacteroidota bacterium]